MQVKYMYKDGLKSSYDDLVSAVDIFDQWNPSTATLMEEVCGLQGGLS